MREPITSAITVVNKDIDDKVILPDGTESLLCDAVLLYLFDNKISLNNLVMDEIKWLYEHKRILGQVIQSEVIAIMMGHIALHGEG